MIKELLFLHVHNFSRSRRGAEKRPLVGRKDRAYTVTGSYLVCLFFPCACPIAAVRKPFLGEWGCTRAGCAFVHRHWAQYRGPGTLLARAEERNHPRPGIDAVRNAKEVVVRALGTFQDLRDFPATKGFTNLQDNVSNYEMHEIICVFVMDYRYIETIR